MRLCHLIQGFMPQEWGVPCHYNNVVAVRNSGSSLCESVSGAELFFLGREQAFVAHSLSDSRRIARHYDYNRG